ncbi:hypothetical protein EJF18_30587 [Clavispora lusitaniae]|uniref:Uncharacterized protein n=2 Tax=Clavispora lusitaniae TaxID=36911 RepID=C4Y2C1_CLAL4|nr:uncharacterized protein CLUG_02684 [Clavispora lusitaniae ATCC 42720]QFZ27609.1 hypothetical protein EJF14_30587 [Clavispora lusitaniae]EEQ38558.1 hypothetical protein CLUG_02684 [Clavispora lusitaniae ATCC 42720]QFZ33084.1 hypothetical protein EJF16_30587 [Clavispora lusitaniae]QFZ38754.1 hypothetical protein EJF15_30587 [Clavispora lusitaniae]QFZ44436.1 hypothetical protein EJF18_30587 [Clavispora lusitaniae]
MHRYYRLLNMLERRCVEGSSHHIEIPPACDVALQTAFHHAHKPLVVAVSGAILRVRHSRGLFARAIFARFFFVHAFVALFDFRVHETCALHCTAIVAAGSDDCPQPWLIQMLERQTSYHHGVEQHSECPDICRRTQRWRQRTEKLGRSIRQQTNVQVGKVGVGVCGQGGVLGSKLMECHKPRVTKAGIIFVISVIIVWFGRSWRQMQNAYFAVVGEK